MEVKSNEDNNYKQLDNFAKSLVEMYITARQFKNAIHEDEMIILPSSNNTTTVLNWGGTKVKFSGNERIIRIYPFIVNKAFACEVYLKLLLKNYNFDINSLKYYERHNLFKLYENTTTKFKEEIFEHFSKIYGKDANKEFIEKQIYNISDVFKHWRYIYEHVNEVNEVNNGFLNIFCNYLDDYCIKVIYERYNYDVKQNMR